MPSGTKTRAAGIALTYDDGPDPAWTPRVLDALASRDALATFFVDTRKARRYPGLVDAVRAAGHEIGFHCVDHVRHSERAGEEVTAEADAGLRALAELGVAPRAWRTPWGVETKATRSAAAMHGLELWHWSADSHDWRGDSAEVMLASIRDEIREGAVVLMHDALGPGARRTGCAETVALTERLLDLAQDRALTPTVVSGDE